MAQALGRRNSARQVAGRALELIGAWPESMAAPTEASILKAVDALSQILDHLAGTHELPWLKTTVNVTLATDTATYDIGALSESDSHCDPAIIEHWRTAFMISPLDANNRTPLELMYEIPWLKQLDCGAIAGSPDRVWIERKQPPIMHVMPVPTSVNAGWTVEITGQMEPGDITKATGSNILVIPASWGRYFAHEVAAQIGDGPVRRLDMGRVKKLAGMAAGMQEELLTYSVDGHRTPQFAEPWEP